LGSIAALEPVVRFAWLAGLLSVAASLGVVLRVIRMRRRLALAERRRDEVFTRWRPVLFEAIAGGSPTIPSLPKEEEDAFLLLWIQLLDGIRGPALARLARVGTAVGAHALARKRIEGKDALGQVFALRTFGYLRHSEDLPEVLRWLDDPRPYVSLAAARAVVAIAPELAPDEILPRLADRTDWPLPLFATVLADSDPDRLSVRLAALCAALPTPALVRLLPLVSLAEARVVRSVLGRLLSSGQDPEVVAAALKQVRSPALLDSVRRGATHERWSVRVQAAAALGRIGEPRDRAVLVSLLRDPEWWVRYRAAQALAARPFGSPSEIATLAAHLGDRFAADIVQQALAEVRE
jgi:hypothetical protein